MLCESLTLKTSLTYDTNVIDLTVNLRETLDSNDSVAEQLKRPSSSIQGGPPNKKSKMQLP